MIYPKPPVQAAPQFPTPRPMAASYAPQFPTLPQQAGGLLKAPSSAVSSGLLGAAGAMSPGGPTSMPVSIGDRIGPALSAFGEKFAAGKALAEKKAREEALIKEYGPEALVPGVLAAKIKAANDLKLRQAAMKSMLGDGAAGSFQEKLEADTGMVFTQDQLKRLRIAYSSGDSERFNTQLEKIAGVKRDAAEKLNKRFERKGDAYSKLIGNANRAAQMLEDLRNGKLNGIDDVEIVYKFISSLDPDSVVREGEIALTNNAMSLINQFTKQLNNILGDEEGKARLFKDGVAQEMLEAIVGIGESADNSLQKDIDYFTGRAEKHKLNIDDILSPVPRFNRAGSIAETAEEKEARERTERLIRDANKESKKGER